MMETPEGAAPIETAAAPSKATAVATPAAPALAPAPMEHAPTRTKSQLDKASELINSFTKDAKSRDVEVVFAFDTTGSMYGHLAEVRKKLRETITRLHRDVPNIRIGVIAVGDYCDQNSSYVVSPFDLSKDVDAIVSFVDKVMPSGGGDAPEAYELALRTVRTTFSWTAGPHNKAVVMIGDASPHAPSYTTEKIWWRDEVMALQKNGVKIYGVQCGNDPTARLFYEEMAANTGGVYMDLAKVSLITDMFLAVCYREFGPEALEAYRVEAEKTTAEPEGLKRMFSQLAAGPVVAAGPKKCPADWYALENDRGAPRYRLDATKRWVPVSGVPHLAIASPAVAAPLARGRKVAKSPRKTASARSASPKKKPSASPRRGAAKPSPRRSRRDDDDDDDEEEDDEHSAAEASPRRMSRNASYAVGAGDWKRDRHGRMSKLRV